MSQAPSDPRRSIFVPLSVAEGDRLIVDGHGVSLSFDPAAAAIEVPVLLLSNGGRIAFVAVIFTACGQWIVMDWRDGGPVYHQTDPLTGIGLVEAIGYRNGVADARPPKRGRGRPRSADRPEWERKLAEARALGRSVAKLAEKTGVPASTWRSRKNLLESKGDPATTDE